MLHEFLRANREELITRCREKVARRTPPAPTGAELANGIPMFLDQVVTTLILEQGAPRVSSSKVPGEIGATASEHGNELMVKGFTVDQVVHDYGDLCQSVTELAAEKNAPITVNEFRTFNRCLDNAIADAVTAFGRGRDQRVAERDANEMNERLGSLAHELRNLLNGAILAFEAIKTGNVAVTGATGRVLDRSLLALRDVIDRSLGEVRLSAGLAARSEAIAVAEFLYDLQVAAGMDAKAHGIHLAIGPIDEALVVDADRQMISSAVSNVMQNAVKFCKPRGTVTLRARAADHRVLIEIEDECGGLPPGKAEELFQPFEQRSSDRTGLGLGLSISRRAVEANGGTLSVRNLPGSGCVFTIDLPQGSPN